ncbi:hypothetical protein SLS59_009739 [Nothophoma quercina]|uniref:Uncharacterized protein n=1 Tax=Nothophoma quercina TaxID=749835 RepID=A0ABR3QK22_9PLEO
MIPRLEQQVSATPTLAEKICEEDLQDPAVSTASVPKSNNKWGRDEHNSAEGMSRRLRVLNNVKSIVERRSQPLQRPQARVVQPDPSFAPVARNPLCNLEFLDYDNSSVPVLYSTKIQHTRSTELQNCPSIDLVNDAFDAIEAGLKPYAQPFVVKKYLKLVGIPKTQPVRFEGRVHPWAKAASRTREKRRVILAGGKIVLEDYQVALTPKIELPTPDAKQDKADAATEAQRGDTGKAEQQRIEVMDVQVGRELSLPLGAIVVVYKIHKDYDSWTYGRLYGTDKQGWFPLWHTCSIDWSLDRFSGSKAQEFSEPLSESKDCEEMDWNGLVHYWRQQGFPEGITWQQMCQATADAATEAEAKRIAKRKSMAAVSMAQTLTLDTTLTRSPSLHITHSLATASEAILVIEATSIVPMSGTEEVDGPDDMQDSNVSESVELTRVTESKAAADSAQPAVDMPETPPGTDTSSKTKEEAIEYVYAASATVSSSNGQVSSPEPDAMESKIPGEKLEAEAEVLTEFVAPPTPQDPFAKSRYHPFARNDNIEYDWGDSDDEL